LEECIASEHCKSVDEPRFCLFTKSGVEPCVSMIDPNMCYREDDSYLFCPANITGICKATVYGSDRMWYRISADKGTCPEMNNVAPISYKGRHLLYGQTFEIDSGEKFLRVKCPANGPFYNQTFRAEFIDDINNNFPLLIPERPCIDEMTVQFGDIFNERADTYEMIFSATVAGGVERAQFINTIVVFGTSLKISNPQSNTVLCNFTAYVGSTFQVTTWWTKGPSNERINVKGPSLPQYYDKMFAQRLKIDQSDEYQCHAQLSYKNCAPHRLFTKTISSEKLFVPYSAE